MSQAIKIALVPGGPNGTDALQQRLIESGHSAVLLPRDAEAQVVLRSNPPGLLIVDLTAGIGSIASLVRVLKEDPNFATVPIIGLVAEAPQSGVEFMDCPLDDFIVLSSANAELFARLDLAVERARRSADTNLLTGLPGYTAIQRAIQHALGKLQTACYVNLNSFKPFNDTFGFARGDDLIRMVGRIIADAVRGTSPGGFSGHFSGDNFAFIVAQDQVELTCQRVLESFKQVLDNTFDEDTRRSGLYHRTDRGGQIKDVPVVGLVIAVVPLANKSGHYCNVADRATELLAYAKQMGGSRYVVDRRR